MTNISLISNSAWTVYNFRRGLINSLQNYGFNVVIFTHRDKYTEKLKAEGFNVIDVKIEGQGRNPLKDVLLINNFRKLFKKHKIEVSLHFTIKPVIYASIAAKIANVKVINNIAGLGNLFTQNSFTTSLVSYLYAFALPSAKYVFFQNTDDRDLFFSKKLVKQNQIKVLPGSGIDTAKFNFVFKEKSIPFLFLMQGRMLTDKGIAEYVEAARLMKLKYANQVEFQVLGLLNYNNPTSIKSDQMRQWIDQGNINYLGRVDDVCQSLQNIHCVVLPSYYREGVPRSLIEAASCGKALITTNHPGCKDVVEHKKNGFLVEPKSVQSLFEAMEKLFLLSNTEYAEMCKYSRSKAVTQFDESIVTNLYLKSILEITLSKT